MRQDQSSTSIDIDDKKKLTILELIAHARMRSKWLFGQLRSQRRQASCRPRFQETISSNLKSGLQRPLPAQIIPTNLPALMYSRTRC